MGIINDPQEEGNLYLWNTNKEYWFEKKGGRLDLKR